MDSRYQKSQSLLERALKTIPLGTQTFSKSKTQFPEGVSPHFIAKGKGSHVWDVDGNEYIDFINSLCSVTLGYCDPDVDKAVSAQLQLGTIFSLPHPLEFEVAEKVCEMVPCAEQVRFGKNGSDATSGAVRIARAYTGKDHILTCGYHGWQDWYIGSTTRSLGVPEIVKSLTHPFPYNDTTALTQLFEKYPNQIAAVILEPMNVADPKPGFLEEVKAITHRHQALLIFDETITGFRFAKGGAQEWFGVVPDLATFGKGIANGYPLSAVAGKAKYMKLMEEIFFSFTFGGETLSLAAASATLSKLHREPVIETIARQGKKVIDGVNGIIHELSLSPFLSISGHPSWSFLQFKDSGGYSVWQLKTLFLQEVFERGILTLGSHNMSYSHSDADIDRLLTVYREVFSILQNAIETKSLEKKLRCEVLTPLFKVR